MSVTSVPPTVQAVQERADGMPEDPGRPPDEGQHGVRTQQPERPATAAAAHHFSHPVSRGLRGQRV